jgi:hypothetical protein
LVVRVARALWWQRRRQWQANTSLLPNHSVKSLAWSFTVRCTRSGTFLLPSAVRALKIRVKRRSEDALPPVCLGSVINQWWDVRHRCRITPRLLMALTSLV